MTDIKVKDSKPKSVKTLDKAVAWTERIKDPIVYANEKAKDSVDNQSNPNDYGSDKIKYVSNRAKDEMMYAGKKVSHQTIEYAKTKYKKNKLIKIKKDTIPDKIKDTQKYIKTSKNVIKNAEYVTKDTLKSSKKIAEQGKKLAIEGSKKAVRGTKNVVKATISSIKAIIAGIKSLVAVLSAGGTLATIVIIVICLIGLLVGSIFGIFFSSEDTGKNNIKMSDCITELNTEMDNQIKQIENMNPHDEVIITSDKAEWKDMLSIYAVRLSNGVNEQEVMSIDEDKKKVLKEVFWDMNTITYEIKTEKYESGSIGSLNIPNFQFNSNYQRPTISENNEDEKKVLHIYINSKSIDEIKNNYAFNENQNKQYEEISGDKYLSLWSSVIYGVYSSSGEITEWKQKGKEWSNIKIGSTNSTIGDIGCLVTSISILIKKSDVPTKNIYPFNPGTFVTALNNNYGFDSRGNLQYAAISKVVPSFQYQGHVNLREKNKSEKLTEIKKYYESGYYIALEVKGATENSQHWVAVDNVSNNSVIMLDPASTATDVWSEYDWNKTSQFVYFKAN